MGIALAIPQQFHLEHRRWRGRKSFVSGHAFKRAVTPTLETSLRTVNSS